MWRVFGKFQFHELCQFLHCVRFYNPHAATRVLSVCENSLFFFFFFLLIFLENKGQGVRIRSSFWLHKKKKQNTKRRKNKTIPSRAFYVCNTEEYVLAIRHFIKVNSIMFDLTTHQFFFFKKFDKSFCL